MRIVIDLQGAQTESRLRGIGRYSLALAVEMARNNRGHEILIALSGLFPETIEPIRAAFRGLIPEKDIRIWLAAGPAAAFDSANNWRRHAAEIVREEFLQSLEPDIVHVSSLVEGFADNAVHSIGRLSPRVPTAVTFYDAIPLIQKKVYLDPHPIFANAYAEKLAHLRQADVLLAISESAREEAILHLGCSTDQVVNIGAAVDARLFRPVDVAFATRKALQEKFGFEGGFLMYSGATDERKNHLRLIEAFSLLPRGLREDYPLLIVGGMPPSHTQRFIEHGHAFGLNEGELVLTGRVTDDELVALYNLCSLFILPSWHEGFGLPALEAMSCGAPAIGSGTSSIPEVIGRTDALFDPHSAAAIADKMECVLRDHEFRDELARHGLEQAKRFSWERSASLALDAFERVVGLPYAPRKPLNGAALPEARVARLVSNIARLFPPPSCEGDLIRVAQAIAFNIGSGKRKQLFLDISTIVRMDAKSGIQRVVRSLLKELRRAPPSDTEVVPIYFEAGHFKVVEIEESGVTSDLRYVQTDEVVDFRQGDSYLALDLNAHLADTTHDIFLRMRQLGVRLYFVVYDILIVHRPDWWVETIAPIFKRWLQGTAEVATGLICISATVADDVSDWLVQTSLRRPDRPLVGSFHLGADIQNSLPSKGLPDDAEQTLELIRSSRSFLMVGTIEPRKGHAQALAAFELLWQANVDVNLVIVGQKGWLVDELHARLLSHPEVGRRLFVLTSASDEFLALIYAASSCLLVPSEGEGFGLPLVEAAQRGLPVLARDLPVFKEVAGAHAHYFHGLTGRELADEIEAWLRLHREERHPNSAAMPWLTWEQSAQQLLQVIENWQSDADRCMSRFACAGGLNSNHEIANDR